jgi:hypothetical protein
MQTTLKNAVATAQWRHCVSITQTNRLTLFGERVTIYYENHMKNINTHCEQNAASLNDKAVVQ